MEKRSLWYNMKGQSAQTGQCRKWPSHFSTVLRAGLSQVKAARAREGRIQNIDAISPIIQGPDMPYSRPGRHADPTVFEVSQAGFVNISCLPPYIFERVYLWTRVATKEKRKREVHRNIEKSPRGLLLSARTPRSRRAG